MHNNSNNDKVYRRLGGLDSLRGISAFFVYVFHFLLLIKYDSTCLDYDIVRFGKSHFALGVPVFFSLSAYTLFYVYYQKFDYNVFWKKRFFRIYPLFLLALSLWCVVFVSRDAPPPLMEFLLSGSLLFNFIPGAHYSLVQAGWSIGIEWIFYMLFPLLILRVRSLEVSVWVFLSSLVFSVGVEPIINNYVGGDFYAFSIFKHGRYFSAGILLFFITRTPFYLSFRTTVPGRVFSVFTVLFVAWLYFSVELNLGVYTKYLKEIELVCLIFFLVNVFLDPLFDARFCFFLRSLGEISYSLYLLHPLLLYCANLSVDYGLFSLRNDFDVLILFIVLTAVLLVVSSVCYQFYEKAFLKRSFGDVRKGVGVFVSILLLGTCWLFLTNLLEGFGKNLLDHHHFRQTQTAIVAQEFLRSGFRFDYYLPVFGPPWGLPFEFPLYQSLVALFSGVSTIKIEIVARVLSIFSLAGLSIILYKLLKFFKVSTYVSFAGGVLLVTSPIYCFWGRSCSIEVFTTFLAVVYLFYSVRSLEEEDVKSLIIATIFGVLASLSKITTFAVIWGFLILYSSGIFFKIRSLRFVLKILFLLGAPLVVGVLWNEFADHVKRSNPSVMVQALLSENLRAWTFGSLRQRLSFDSILVMLNNGPRNTFHLALLIPLLFFRIDYKKVNWFLVLAACLAYFSGPIVFFNLYLVHDYYWCANSFFAILIICLLFGGQNHALRFGKSKYLFLLFCVCSLIVAIGQYRKHPYWFYQTRTDTELEAISHLLHNSVANEDDVILIIGHQWNPAISFYSERRSIMPFIKGSLFDKNTTTMITELYQNNRFGGVLIKEEDKAIRESTLLELNKVCPLNKIPIFVYDDNYFYAVGIDQRDSSISELAVDSWGDTFLAEIDRPDGFSDHFSNGLVWRVYHPYTTIDFTPKETAFYSIGMEFHPKVPEGGSDGIEVEIVGADFDVIAKELVFQSDRRKLEVYLEKNVDYQLTVRPLKTSNWDWFMMSPPRIVE